MIFLRWIYLKSGRRVAVYALRRRRKSDIWAACLDELRRTAA